MPPAFTRDASSSSVQIFLADADDALRAEIAATLQHDGHDVVECADQSLLRLKQSLDDR